MNSREEARFENVLNAAIAQAKQLGYYPTRFVGMIASKGAFQTVKDIVASGKPSEGFEKLVLYHRTDLTCEAIIVETEWRSFFDDDLLQIAQDRLTKYGYQWRASTSSRASSSSSIPPSPEAAVAAEFEDFLPPTEDDREKVLREEYCRQGQAEFRAKLIKVYGARCLITGITIPEALEAAHICAYRGPDSHHLRNGLLLRADLHSLFDRFMFGVDPDTLAVRLSPRLRASNVYAQLDDVNLILNKGVPTPSVRALRVHWSVFLREKVGAPQG
jgi:hypothetical protein